MNKGLVNGAREFSNVLPESTDEGRDGEEMSADGAARSGRGEKQW